MIYRPSDCGCCTHEHPLRPRPRCCCIPFCCPPWNNMEYPQSPAANPRPISSLQVLSTVNTTTQTVAAGGTLPFTTNAVSIGTAISHAGSSPNVIISVPGVYRVDFNSTASPLTTTELSASVDAELTLNGSPVPGAALAEVFTGATDESSVSLHAILEVTTVPATLSITSESGAEFGDTVFSVERLGSLPTATTSAPYPNYPI